MQLVYLPLRWGRWLACSRRLLVAFLFLILGVSGLAYDANRSIPELQWQPGLTGPDVPPAVYRILVNEQTGTLYARTSRVFSIPQIRGASWQIASTELLYDIQALVTSRDALYAGTWGTGIFRSLDGGASWQMASAGLTNTSVIDLAASEDVLYAGRMGERFFGQWMVA